MAIICKELTISSCPRVSLQSLLVLVGLYINFILEVAGAAGAFWGATQVIGLRNENNSILYDRLAIATGGLAAIRFFFKFILPCLNNKTPGDKFMKTIVSPFETIDDAIASSLSTPLLDGRSDELGQHSVNPPF